MSCSGLSCPRIQVKRSFQANRLKRCEILYFVEPIGSALPKFASKDKINAFSAGTLSTLSLMCPAQGYPLPAFRFVDIDEKGASS